MVTEGEGAGERNWVVGQRTSAQATPARARRKWSPPSSAGRERELVPDTDEAIVPDTDERFPTRKAVAPHDTW